MQERPPKSGQSEPWQEQLNAWRAEVRAFPWKQLGHLLLQRFREARLGVSASSLTFTTVLALVPLFAVVLSVFTAFPVFGKFQDTIQRWLVESLVPESIARQVLGHVTQFARKASRLGAVGLVAVMVTALALMVTIERTLGQIWRVDRPRTFAKRVLLYWAAITLGPLMLGASLAITSYLVSASQQWVAVPAESLRWLLDVLEFLLLVLCVSGLYFYVPHTRVRWRHALTGGVLAALGLELAKRALTWYLSAIPTYSAIYGAFAALPILLVWLYLAWVIVLLGAVLAASLPQWSRPHRRSFQGPDGPLRLALEVLTELRAAQRAPERGLGMARLARQLQTGDQDMAQILHTLQELDWVASLHENLGGDPRWVLLIDPAQTLAAPLMARLLLGEHTAPDRVWASTQWDRTLLQELLPSEQIV
jgi:membrane protein